MAGKNPIKFTDTTFRDGHQSLLATRMRTEDIVPFMERMDQMGYWAIEVWGARLLIPPTVSWETTPGTASAPSRGF